MKNLYEMIKTANPFENILVREGNNVLYKGYVKDIQKKMKMYEVKRYDILKTEATKEGFILSNETITRDITMIFVEKRVK